MPLRNDDNAIQLRDLPQDDVGNKRQRLSRQPSDLDISGRLPQRRRLGDTRKAHQSAVATETSPLLAAISRAHACEDPIVAVRTEKCCT